MTTNCFDRLQGLQGLEGCFPESPNLYAIRGFIQNRGSKPSKPSTRGLGGSRPHLGNG
jgi:hypothetical protein